MKTEVYRGCEIRCNWVRREGSSLKAFAQAYPDAWTWIDHEQYDGCEDGNRHAAGWAGSREECIDAIDEYREEE